MKDKARHGKLRTKMLDAIILSNVWSLTPVISSFLFVGRWIDTPFDMVPIYLLGKPVPGHRM